MVLNPSFFLTNFSTIDWLIVFVYILFIVTVGVLLNRYIRNTSDYMVSGRSVGLALNTSSYVGTELGLVTMMYASIEGFNRGFSYLIIPVFALVAAFTIGQTGFVVSKLRELKLTTIPEFFERRFDKKTRVTSAIIMALAGILNMGLFPKMGAIFMTYVTGLAAGKDATIIVNLVITILIIFVVLYTVMGGMVSVIVCDYIQFTVLSIGLLLGLYFSFTYDNLNWNNIISVFFDKMREPAFNPFHPDSYGWFYNIWMFVVFFAIGIAWGPVASRALTAESPKTAQRTFLLGSPGQFIRLGIPAMFGFAAFAWFSQHSPFSEYFFPDGIADASKAAQAMPLLLGKIIPSGFIGVLVAGMLAAFMSTHDSYFIAWASIISRDIITPLKKGRVSDKQEILYARIIIILIGVFLLIWSLWYELPESIWTYMAISGNIYLSGASVALIGGICWKKASRTGAFAALLGGMVSLLGIIPAIANNISSGLLGLGNYLFCLMMLIIFSILFPHESEYINEKK